MLFLGWSSLEFKSKVFSLDYYSLRRKKKWNCYGYCHNELYVMLASIIKRKNTRWEGTDMQKTILDKLSFLIADIYRCWSLSRKKKWPCVLQCCELGKPSVVDFNSVESTSWLERVATIYTISGNFINRFLVAFCHSFIQWLHVHEIIFKPKLKRSVTQINEPEKREISLTDFIYLHHVY